ncbi:MAG TPA: hydantoinase B/oxoprolinase family protein [bacterium]|nr:hydantoinase B/oxoprolinase family protein [bacterium]
MIPDPVTVEVIRNAMIYAAEEMGIALRNASYSPNIKERMDHSCALFDAAGRLIAQAEHIPADLGSLPWGVRATLALLQHRPPRPGDLFILNDPYIAGTHLNDIMLVRPLFWQGTIVGYSVNKAHHVDVGGRTPGSLSSDARELCEEGIVIPLLPILREGVEVPETVEVILANVRSPDTTRGDLRAQIAAASLGERRVAELLDRYGREAVEAAWEAILDQGEASARRAFAVLPPGRYTAEDCLEDDLADGGLRWIRVAVIVAPGAITVDFAGTDPQVPRPINAILGVTNAAVLYALKAVCDPDSVMNDGWLRPVTLRVPLGTVINPVRPAPVGVGNTETNQRIADTVLRALAKAAPGRVPAASNGSMTNVAMGGFDPGAQRTWTFYETIAGGMGGRPGLDGIDGIHCNMTNTMNTPIEAIEQSLPMRFRAYELRPGTGGAGRWRGGCGVRREWELLAEEATISILAERTRVAPWGLAGGGPGGLARHLVRRADGTEEVLPSKHTTHLRRGDVLVIQTPGGAGYGDPAERDPEAVDRDRERGLG